MLSKVIQKVQKVILPQDSQQSVDLGAVKFETATVDAINEAKLQLIKINLIKSVDLIRKIQLVLDLDEKLYRKVKKLTHEYLIPLANNPTLKAEIEEGVYEYLRQLYTTYTLIISEYQLENKPLLNTEKIILLLARYLNVIFMMAKWRYFSDQPAPLGMWKNVHKIIKVAEDLKVLNKSLFLYSNQHKETSLAAILKRGFMLDTLQNGGYTQFQIELADRVLRIWSANPQITKEYKKQNEVQFFISLSEDNRPARLRGAKQHSDFRYWKTTRIVDLIETYLCAVDTNKPLEAFNLNTIAKTDDIVALFKMLRRDWCVFGYKRQRRAEDRAKAANVVNVSHGIEAVGARIQQLQFKSKIGMPYFEDASLALDLVSPAEHRQIASDVYPSLPDSWTMLEESESGFSVALNKEISPWVKSGALIGYTILNNSREVALAEIKTVRKGANGSYRIGLLKITNNAIALQVDRVEKVTPFVSSRSQGNLERANDELFNGFSGLLVDDGLGKRPRLIVPRHQYKRAARYRIKINDADHIVLAGELTSSHRDWVCFEVII